MTAKFRTFKFEPDFAGDYEDTSIVFRELARKIAGNCIEIDMEEHFEDGVITGTDVVLGVWATDVEWQEILDCWHEHLKGLSHDR